LQPAVKRWDKHLAPILRTEDHRVLAARYDGAVTVYFVRYPLSIPVQDLCSIHLWDLSQAQSPWLTTFCPLYPTAHASGFYRAYHKEDSIIRICTIWADFPTVVTLSQSFSVHFLLTNIVLLTSKDDIPPLDQMLQPDTTRHRDRNLCRDSDQFLIRREFCICQIGKAIFAPLILNRRQVMVNVGSGVAGVIGNYFASLIYLLTILLFG
jgi:hypothetical protein